MEESNYEIISDELNEIYTSGVEAQKDIAIKCLELMINYNFSLIYKVIESSLQKSYFDLCRGIFEIYNGITEEDDPVAMPLRRRNMNPKEVLKLILEEILDHGNAMARMNDREGVVDLINEYTRDDEESEEESEDEDDELLVIRTLRERNYRRALNLITAANESGDAWISRALLNQVYRSMKEQTDTTNKDVLVRIFDKVLGEGFEEQMSDNLHEMYESGVEAQKEIVIECLEIMIDRHTYLIPKVIMYCLEKSYFNFCRAIFDIYKRAYEEDLYSILEEILGDEDTMGRMDDRDGVVDLINEYIQDDE
jgi:hypothetical protein